jgi:toxin ParE1/3/4
MKPFRITSSASADLDDIWLFIAQDDPETADRFHDLLLSKFLALGKQPLIGRPRDDLRPDIRSFPVGNYIIFYRDQPAFVEIVRVLHAARDLEGVF